MIVSVDIETLATSFNAAIVQIAAVKLHPSGVEVGALSRVIDRDQGRAIDQDTLDWWSQFGGPPDERTPPGDLVDLPTALGELAAMIQDGDTVWAKGPSFDLVILRHAYAQHGQLPPWHYRHERCVRTAQAQIRARGIQEPVLRGTAHDALADARHQGEIIKIAMEYWT
ncbi:MAG: 3'-5' exonuclease [Halothiobacillaceae bacterium]